jgi:hypothetical protein
VVRFVKSQNIVESKWDKLIGSYKAENVFSYSWYLNAVSESWGAIVVGDYESVLPVTYTTKVGVKQNVQAAFTREFQVLGNQSIDLKSLLPALESQFKNIQFRTAHKITETDSERVHQFLDLTTDFKNEYSTNAKRLIKKSDKNYAYKIVDCVDELIELVNETVAHKIAEFTPKNIEKLKRLMIIAKKNNSGDTIAVFDENKIVAAGFFLKDKSRITYLKGASLENAKKNGAMYGLLNFAFENYLSSFSTFDFGGSDVTSVAQFYKKFGALDRTYYEITINNLPFWFKGLKKLKR